MEYKVKLNNFEGSFDLLYHLINRAEVDIWEIPLAEITKQYLDFLQQMEDLNIEMTSDFLVMAATLLRLKSRLLLPIYEDKEEESEDDEILNIKTKEELFQRVLEYRLFKKAGSWLKEKELEQKKIFLRPKGDKREERVIIVTQQGTLYPYNGNLLAEIWFELHEKSAGNNLSHHFRVPEEFSLKDKIKNILSFLKQKGQNIYFHFICPRGSKKAEIIGSFLAVLELASKRKVLLQQKTLFGNILVKFKDLSREEDNG